jgi:hypothetical protein
MGAANDAYLRGIFYCPDCKPVFHHLRLSKTNPYTVVSVQGWPQNEEAKEYWDVVSEDLPDTLNPELC